MNLVEKAAYLKGLAEGLGMDAQSKEGRLWAALNDLLADMAHEIEDLHEADDRLDDALDELAGELSYLEELSCDLEKLDDDDDGAADDDDAEYDGVVYDATCPVCGEEISFDEETLESGSIRCPKCGELLEFDLGADAGGRAELNRNIKKKPAPRGAGFFAREPLVHFRRSAKSASHSSSLIFRMPRAEAAKAKACPPGYLTKP